MKELKLKIGGVDYTFSLGLGFLGELLEETDLGIDDIIPKMIKNPFKWVPAMMFYSAKFTKDLNNEEFDFTTTTILEGLETEPGGINCKQSLKFMRALNKSMYNNVPVSDEVETEDDSKKK